MQDKLKAAIENKNTALPDIPERTVVCRGSFSDDLISFYISIFFNWLKLYLANNIHDKFYVQNHKIYSLPTLFMI